MYTDQAFSMVKLGPACGAPLINKLAAFVYVAPTVIVSRIELPK